MLGTRVATGCLLVALLVAVLILDERLAPWFPLWLVASLAALGVCAVELSALLGATGARPSGNAVFGGTITLVLANWAPHVVRQLGVDPTLPVPSTYEPSSPVDVMAWPLWAFVAVLMASFLTQSIQFRGPGRAMATISGTVLAVAYLGLLGSFIIQMRWFDGPYHGLVPLISLVATAKGSDIGAYALGRIAGRTKLWPRLSPNKTVEGAVGGLVLGVAASVGVAAGARLVLHAPGLGWAESVGFGLLVAPAAMLGDLMESMIKRDCAAKDASAAVPGFGGMLDVLDSLLFAAPVAYGYWICFGP